MLPSLAFTIGEPLGLDTYVMLASEEPLADPSILVGEPVRSGTAPATSSPLAATAAEVNAGRRAARLATPARWRIERVTLRSRRPAEAPASPAANPAR